MENIEKKKEDIIDIQLNNEINNPDNKNILRENNFFESSNINNKKVLEYIYGNEIFKIVEDLSKFKENSCNFIKKTEKELNIKHDYFKNEILKYLNSTTNKIINAFHLDLSKINEENTKIVYEFAKEKLIFLNKVISLYNQIIEVIQQNLSILKNFLQNFDLNQEYPLQDFFSKEFDNIINSWLFLKLDLEKFNFKKVIEETNLKSNYKEFLLKECQEKNSVMNIILPENKFNLNKKPTFKLDNYKDEIKFLSENSNHLVELNMTNVHKIEDLFGKMKYNRLKKLKLKNSYIGNTEIFNDFPSLNQLIIKYCPYLDSSIFNNINHLNLI
jgi:hypothetical protein